MKNKTLILATLGPSFCESDTLRQAILMGITSFRQPFGYRDQAHFDQFKLIRQLSHQLSVNCQVITDLPSDRLRIGKLVEQELQFNSKDKVKVIDSLSSYDKITIPIPRISSLIKLLKKDSQILIRDGNIKLKVLEKTDDELFCEIVQASQVLKNNNNTHFPDIQFNPDLITKDDRVILEEYNKNSLTPDWVAISFVKNANDIKRSNEVLFDIFKKKIKIIAKIETPEALKNIREITLASDGLMVARGDMGIVIPIEKVPYYQKIIIQNGINFEKPVIVATQMMENYADTEIPNRAEISDVFTAVQQGAYAVMLSRETSGSKNPLKVLKMIKKIVDFSSKIRENKYSLDDRKLIIAIEGIDGSGKTTIAKELASALSGTYIATPPSPFKIHQDFFEEKERAVLSRFFYYIGSLWESWKEIEAESRTKIVVLDRYLLSTNIYHQTLVNSNDIEYKYIIQDTMNSGAPPNADINIVLDVSEKIAIERLKNKKQKVFDEQLEQNRDLQKKLAEKFRNYSDVVINTDKKSINEIVNECIQIINQLKQ